MTEKTYIKQILTIKDYKLTLNSFTDEEKIDRPKKKSRYFVDLIQAAIQTNDLDCLLKIWKDYEILYFRFLDFDKQRTADIIKSDMFKTFLVECHKNKKSDKINVFFQTMGSYILTHKDDWSDWFEFPFVKFPSEHKIYALYFTRLWMENFFLTMSNFFMQVVRSVICNESDLEKFFSLDMRLDNCNNQLNITEIESLRQKYNLLDISDDKNQLLSQMLSSLSCTPRYLHDVAELLCDFRLSRENRQLEYRKTYKTNKPKGIGLIIQNKVKPLPNTGPRKKTFYIDVNDLKINPEKPEEQLLILQLPDPEHRVSLNDETSNASGTQLNSVHHIPPSPEKSGHDTFGIKVLSNKIAQKIFGQKSNSNSEIAKPLIHHEHFSMVTHVKFSRAQSPYWASLDVGGTFKIWSINEASSKSLHTLSFKHTIYSFDWISSTTNMILLGTKGGSIKAFNVDNNEITHEMIIDSAFPRINIVQSYENESKFVCESLDRSRATFSSSSLPQGIISLYDAESWSPIRTNLMKLNSDFMVNCMNCSADTIVVGCSNGSIHLLDARLPSDAVFSSLPVFVGDEIVNVTSMCHSKWAKSTIDSNYIFCLSSKSNLKMFDLRHSSKSIPKESFHLVDLNIPLSWTERPYGGGGEQTIYFPRANLISAAYMNNNFLFSAAKKGILLQPIVGSTLLDHTSLHTGHNSPVICIDSSPCDLSTDNNNVVIISGSMEGTISMMKINNTSIF